VFPDTVYEHDQPSKNLIRANIFGFVAICFREKKCECQCDGKIPCLLVLNSSLGSSQKSTLSIAIKLNSM
jgi:hypothetical protein